MSGPCSARLVEGDPTAGQCTHPARYQDSGSADWCACHYGEPYDPAQCYGRHANRWTGALVEADQDERFVDNSPRHVVLDEGDDGPEEKTLIAPRSARQHANANNQGYPFWGGEVAI